MSLDHTRRVFEALGRDDPLYAVLTRDGMEGGRWDPDEFFALGRARVQEALDRLDALGIRPRRGQALDFGCGVGRLTEALADHFQQVVGVDISAPMIEAARRYSRNSGVEYVVNTAGDLARFATGRFDFVFSAKTLQHIPPEHQRTYVREFVRLLTPGGVAMFQFRNGPWIEPGTLRARLYHLRRHHLRRLVRRLRRRPEYEMHFVNRDELARIVAAGEARVEDVEDLSRGRPGRNLRMVVRKPGDAWCTDAEVS